MLRNIFADQLPVLMPFDRLRVQDQGVGFEFRSCFCQRWTEAFGLAVQLAGLAHNPLLNQKQRKYACNGTKAHVIHLPSPNIRLYLVPAL